MKQKPHVTAANDGKTTLLLNPKTMDIKLKSNDDTWDSVSFSNGSTASSADKSINSLFAIEGYYSDGTEFVLDSWVDCISKGQYSVNIADGKATVEFYVGEVNKREVLPVIIRKDQFEKQILSKLGTEDKSKFKQRYKLYTPKELKSDSSLKKSITKEYPAAGKYEVYILKKRLYPYRAKQS